jgi:hypothetical protein
MNWTRPPDLRAQVQRLWDSGRWLSTVAKDERLFPLRLSLKCPTSIEIAGQFAAVREWISELTKMQHVRIVMSERKHRVFGSNLIPAEAWIDSVDEATALIGKQRDLLRFSELIQQTREHQPPLLAWLSKRPLRALELYAEWARILAVVAWIHGNPRPNVYLRQVDIPGVHTKFIETHRGVLQELLDLVLPPDTIDSLANGTSRFTKRYGFRDKPSLIRFRMLDPSAALLKAGELQDISLDADSFSKLSTTVARVFIVENEINFLAFPQVHGGMVIFGAGYGFDVMRQATWLSDRSIYYWGDIDTHGFGILDQMRSILPTSKSFLMDRQTLVAHQSQWDSEPQPLLRDLPHLDDAESALFDDLRNNRMGMHVRLEQERVGFGWFENALRRIHDNE